MATQPPLLDRAAPAEREAYETFFQKTESNAIDQFAKGESLTNLVDCAQKIHSTLIRCNPIFDTWDHQWGNLNDVVRARQWEINKLSAVKHRLAQAVELKRGYYENHWFGQITKFVLKLFCLWNEGNTPSIVTAEDFLLRWDLRYPVVKIGGNYEKLHFYTLLVSPDWYRQNLDTQHFFNYDPTTRTIPVKKIAPADQPPAFMVRQTP